MFFQMALAGHFSLTALNPFTDRNEQVDLFELIVNR
jgi:hypothetical protein